MVVRKLKDCNTDHTPSGLTVDWITEQLDGSDLFEVRRVTIKVGGKSSHESHAHEHGVFVLSGEGVLIGDDGEHSLSKDSCAFVAGNETHQWINTSKTEPLIFICVIPSGAENFYKKR